MQLKIHSVADVITNSSEVIYTFVRGGAIDLLKSAVNHILQIAGSHLTAEDLFKFEIQKVPKDDMIDDARYNLLWNEVEGFSNLDYRERAAFFKELQKSPPDWWDDLDLLEEHCDRSPYETFILVTAKHPGREEAAKVLSRLDELFEQKQYNTG